MEDFNSKMVEVIKGLTMYDKKTVITFPDFKDHFSNHISMASSKMYQILLGDEPPAQTTGGDLVKWNRANNNLWSILFIVMKGGALTLVKCSKGKSREGGAGD